MQKSQLQELALGLAGLLDFQIPENADPFEPTIILQALNALFPQDQEQLKVIKQVDEVEQQWSCVLEYIEINLLDGQTLEIESLGEQEITQIYLLLIQFAQHAIKEQEEEQLLKNRQKNPKSKKQSREKVSQEKEKKKQPEKANSKKKQQKGNKAKKNNQIQIKDSKKEKNPKISNNQPKVKEKSVKGKKEPKGIEQRDPNKNKSKSKNNQKQISRQKQKSKSKSKSKSKNKLKDQKKSSPQMISRNNKQGREHKKEAQKQQSPKKEIVSNQPLQNEAIRQITAAMKNTKKKQTNKILLKDPKSHQQVLKAKRQFDYYLNEFKRQGKQNKSDNKKGGKGILDQYFLKVIEKRQKDIQQTIVNEQIKYLLQLRDKKIAFINKIHKLTEKLERQRVIEKEKEQKKLMEQQRIKTQLKIQQSNAVFDKNMELLKQNYKVMRQKNQLQTYDQRVVCRQMQECMKRKKLDQLQELKLLWQQQNLKLNNIMGDEQKIKNKLIDIYRKNRP